MISVAVLVGFGRLGGLADLVVEHVTTYINGICASIRHIYFLRLAYNNLNPKNIALNSNDNPIILNFRFCKKFSKELLLEGIYS